MQPFSSRLYTCTPFAIEGQIQCVEVLINAGTVTTRLTTALLVMSARGCVSAVVTLLALGADVNYTVTNHFGVWGSLFFTAREGHVECLKTLLEAGADVDDRCFSAIGIAARHPNHEKAIQCVELLCNAGWEINQRGLFLPLLEAVKCQCKYHKGCVSVQERET